MEKGMGNRRMKKRKKKMNWQKKLDKALTKVIKEQKKTIHAKEKIHRKAAKARKKKVEKSIDRILIGGCFIICLIAAFMEAKENKE